AAEIGLPLLGCEAPGLSRRPPRPSPAACAPDPISSCVDLGHRRRRGSRRSLRTRSGCPRPRRKRGAEAEPVMARQVPVAFQDLAVRFSEDEWRLLGEKQRALFLDVMQENYETLVSLGTAELPPLSAFLSPTEPGGPMEDGSCSGDRQERPRGGSPLSGAPQHSLHLTALVQLVKEIPEFLFGEVSPQSGGAGLDGEGASPEAAVMEDTCPLQGPLGCLPDTPISRPGLAATPSGSSSSGPSGARGQGSPFPTETADKPRSVEEEGPAAPGGEPSPPTCSPGRRKSRGNRERGPPGAGAAEISPGNSPLQGLINCLKEILEPGPQPSEGPLGVPHPVPTGASRLTRAELGPASPPWAVKTEAASGDCPLQGLLNCLKEIPEPRDRHPSPSAAGDSRLQEDPAAWKRSSGGPRPLQTPPPGPGPGPGAGSVLSVVKTEDGWAPSLLLPVSCQLSKQMHSPTAAGSPGDSGDTTRVQVSCWGPAAQEVVMGPLLALGLQGCMRDSPALPPGSQGTPTSFSSSSSTDGDLDFQSSEGSQGHRRGKGMRGEACEPAHPGQHRGNMPTGSLQLASPQALASGTIPTCFQRGLKDPGATRPGRWRWLQDEPASKPSPLHCLENSLKGILPGGPLRFACLASPSASTSASPGSSFSSSEGEDLRPEPELWQPLLPERDRLPSCKGLGPLSLRPGGPCARSSPGEGPKKGEPKYHCGLSAGKAEEKTGGRSQLPWREVCSETPGTAVDPCPAPQLEKRRGPEPCQPPGSAHGPLSWKPRASEESRGLGPGDGRPVVTGELTASPPHRIIIVGDPAARTGGMPLPQSLPEPPAVATVPPALPLACPQPPCPCGSSLQQELCSLGAALLEKLDRLEVALAGLSQEVAAVRTQVDRLGRRPRGPGPKGLPRGPRWASSPARRHLPYWRQKGPTRPRPKILGGPAEGSRAGDSGLSSGRLHLVPQLPPDTHPAEPSGPSSSPSQQPLSSACSSRTMLTVHHPLRHTGGCQSPPPPSVPAALPPQVAPPMTSADVERLAAVAVPTRTLNWPKDPSRLLAGFQRALEGELWGGEHRDPKWGPPDCRLHGLSPVEDAPPRLPLQGASLPPPPPPAEPSPYLGREGARRLPLV
ncbi:Protein KRBA1, partial [Camelus dromedarius]